MSNQNFNKILNQTKGVRAPSTHQYRSLNSSSQTAAIYFKIKNKICIKNENIAEFNKMNNKQNNISSSYQTNVLKSDTRLGAASSTSSDTINKDLTSSSLLSFSINNNNNSTSTLTNLDETNNQNKYEDLNDMSILNFSSYGSLLAYEFTNKNKKSSTNNSISFNNKSNYRLSKNKMISSNHTTTSSTGSASTVNNLNSNSSNSMSTTNGGDNFMKLYNNNDLKYPFVLRNANTSLSNVGNLSARSIKSTESNSVNKKTRIDSAYLTKRREMTNLTSVSNNATSSRKKFDLSLNLSLIDDSLNMEHNLQSSSISDFKQFKKPEYNAYIQKLKEKNLSANNNHLKTTFSNNLTNSMIDSNNSITNTSNNNNNNDDKKDNIKSSHEENSLFKPNVLNSSTNLYQQQKSKSSLSAYDKSYHNLNNFSLNNIIYNNISTPLPNSSNNNTTNLNGSNYEFSKSLIDRIRIKEISSRSHVNLNILFKGYRNSLANNSNITESAKSNNYETALSKSSDITNLSLSEESNQKQKLNSDSTKIDTKPNDSNRIMSSKPINTLNDENNSTDDQITPKRVTSALINKSHFFRTDSGKEVNKFSKQQYESSKAYFVNGKNINYDLAKLANSRREKTELSLSNKIIHFLPKFTKSLSKLNKAAEKNLEKRYINETINEQPTNNSISLSSSVSTSTTKEFKYSRERSILNLARKSSDYDNNTNISTNDNENANHHSNSLLKISKLNEPDNVLDKVSAKELDLINQRFFGGDNNSEISNNSDKKSKIVLVKESSSLSSKNNNFKKDDEEIKVSKTTQIIKYQDKNEPHIDENSKTISSSATITSNRSITSQRQRIVQSNPKNSETTENESNINEQPTQLKTTEPSASAPSTIIRISKKRVSFHESVIEMDFDSGNSILKPININEFF